jgi:hypothetical protein
MPKMLVEGYRPGKGDGGRWFGVIDGRSNPKKTATGEGRTAARNADGSFVEPKLPRGGSAIQFPSSKK